MTKKISVFRVGKIFNPLSRKVSVNKAIFQKVRLEFPSRLNAMALDPSKITNNNSFKYSAGQITFSIDLCKEITASILPQERICRVTERSQRASLIKHVCALMRAALGFNEGILIDVDNKEELKHVGLGSSGSLAGGVAVAINELYGCPLAKEEILRYLAQNYGEEIENSPGFLAPVQCVGGSIATGLWEGSMILIAGENEVIKATYFDDYDVVMGIPKDFKNISSEKALAKELEHMGDFVDCGRKYSAIIAYQILHKVLPAMNRKDLKTIGDVIYDYRFNMGSIKNCSFIYPNLSEITQRLSFLKIKGITDVLSISSVGPLVFAITKRKNDCISAFTKEGLNVYSTKLRKEPYRVLEIK
jgi:predicted sugar kinase